MTIREAVTSALGWGMSVDHPRPRPDFARIPRRRFEAHCAALEQQRDRALGQRRAHADWIAAQLEGFATACDLDAQHADTPDARRQAHRIAADLIRDLIRDLEEFR